MADEHKEVQPRAVAPSTPKPVTTPAHPAPPPQLLPQKVQIDGTVKIESSGKDLSFLGSLGWPIFALIVVIILCRPITGILNAFKKRIEDGDEVKSPWLTLVKSQSVKQADQRAERKAEEIQEEVAGFAPNPQQGIRIIKSRYVLAQDLALQELEAEFKVPVSANVSTGNLEFDGIFGVNDVGYLVEVKLVRTTKSTEMARRSLLSLYDRIRRVGWKNPRGVLVIVYDAGDVNLQFERRMIEDQAREFSMIIEVRTYSLRALAEKYKVALPND